MPTDLQIIDGFERLRKQFLEENAESSLPTGEPAGIVRDTSRIVEAWIQAMDGRLTRAPAQQRRLRRLSRALLDPNQDRSKIDPADQRLLERGRDLPERLAHLPTPSPARSSMDTERQFWSERLPGLTGLRPWRFLEGLGHPIVMPDRPMRRLLWRLGLIEQPPHSEGSILPAHSAAEHLRTLTGMPTALLDRLIRWHVTSSATFKGGGRCRRKPHCSGCAFQEWCMWVRFHPPETATPDPSAPASPPHALELLRRQITADKTDRLEEIELLAAVLQAGPSGGSALELAQTLMRRFGDLRALARATVAHLCEIKGISRARAVQLKAAIELGRRLAEHSIEEGRPITCSQDVWMAYRARFRDLPQEHFVVLLLDAKNRVIHDRIVSKGSLTGSPAAPREVFGEAIRHAAAALILLHNHPSGDPQPSQDDRAVTTRLRQAGDLLGIPVLDHLILGAEYYYSFKDEEEF